MAVNGPRRVLDRLGAKFKSYQGVAASRCDRDVSESDTATLVKDIHSDVFGFDTYLKLTSAQP
jgi:hypothetical protein